MLLDYVACGYVVYRLGLPLVRSLPNPRRFEEERLRRFRESNVWLYIRRAIFDFTLIGAACLVAWRHADLGLIWLGFGIILIALAIPAGFAWTVNKINPVPPVEAFPPPSEEQLDRLTKSRLRACAVQFALLVAWGYSWRHLVINE